MRKRSWTIEQLKDAVKESTSFRQVLKKIGLREAGGNYFQLQKYVRELKIDITHFKGKAWNKGLHGIGKPKLSLKEILVKNSNFQSYKLKKRLFAAGLKCPECELCGWAESVNGRIPLELDHINGDVHDNRLENLRILCPNCHSLQLTHRALNKKKKKGRVAERYTHNT
jgi:5-methylcytosine-specific restriction endonuclease McrA